jgi:hypothetical protein
MLDSPNLDAYVNATLELIEIPAFPYTLRQKALGRRTSPSTAKSLLCLELTGVWVRAIETQIEPP